MMTSKQIEEQIAVLRKVGAEVSVSKEAALAFLQRAGILGPDGNLKSDGRAKKAAASRNKAK